MFDFRQNIPSWMSETLALFTGTYISDFYLMHIGHIFGFVFKPIEKTCFLESFTMFNWMWNQLKVEIERFTFEARTEVDRNGGGARWYFKNIRQKSLLKSETIFKCNMIVSILIGSWFASNLTGSLRSATSTRRDGPADNMCTIFFGETKI